ncbi:RNA-binding protein squid-like isoform X2 [Paramacrobiotus metropolitanus]|uniref:RNA-binding protein squid-like isoform X2 n=1 Tax=Paramacrobiotus metropolitanus TaxID=2943436 RepID=UPI002445E232|nr:RNA-binding protein squid-like isoform X2 [Paramacrobiotus metropolitanus]
MAFVGNGDAAATANGVTESSEPVDKRKIFVGGLPADAGEEDLKTYFSQFGSVQHTTVKRDLASGRSRCFGFVTFADSAAVKAVGAVPSHTMKGKKIDPKAAAPRPGEEPVTKIFVGGLDSNMSEDDLKIFFEKFGKVKTIEWPKDRMRDNAKKNFAFVDFEDEKVVTELIKTPKHTIGDRQCDVRKAIPQQKTQGAPGGGWQDYGNPYGSPYGPAGGYGAGGYGAGGYGAAGGYGDGSYASYYGAQGYDQNYYADPNAASGYYGGYDYSAYPAAPARGGMHPGARGRGAPAAGSPRGAARGAAGAAARGAVRGFHPYMR